MGSGGRDGLTPPITPLQVAATGWHALCAYRGIDPAVTPLGRVAAPAPVPGEAAPPTPWELGARYERALTWSDRHRRGVHYTPPEVAHTLVELAARPGDPGTVCDPAVGGGAFLLAAAEVLARRGVPTGEIIGRRLLGIDVDPDALIVAAAALTAWSVERGGPPFDPAHLLCGDALRLEPAAVRGWLAGRGVELVVGNPPFQGQLSSDTARDPAAGRELRDRWQIGTGAYVDTAALFLLAGVGLAAPRGRIALLQPWSTLAASGAEAVRRRLDTVAPPVALWAAGRGLFDAAVVVCAPVLEVGAPMGPVRRLVGPGATDGGSVRRDRTEVGRWSRLVGDLGGSPAVDLPEGATLATMATATAGFRQQFYGLAPHVYEAAVAPSRDQPALVTVGMIDPAVLRWGSGRLFRFAGRRLARPCVDRTALEAADRELARWVSDRLRPKILVATQTRVIEAIVDGLGVHVPSTPVISVEPTDPADLWPVAAVVSAPAVSAWALSRFSGAALTVDRLRISARQLVTAPLPANHRAWEHGATVLAALHREPPGTSAWDDGMAEFARSMDEAYGVGAAVSEWWHDRRPASD